MSIQRSERLVEACLPCPSSFISQGVGIPGSRVSGTGPARRWVRLIPLELGPSYPAANSYSFRPRFAKSATGKYFVSFSPAISNRAAREIRKTMRDLHFSRRTDLEIEDLARKINPMLRGWVNYFGVFHRSALYAAVVRPLEEHLARWAIGKYRRLRWHRKKAREWVASLLRDRPMLFAHQMRTTGTVG